MDSYDDDVVVVVVVVVEAGRVAEIAGVFNNGCRTDSAVEKKDRKTVRQPFFGQRGERGLGIGYGGEGGCTQTTVWQEVPLRGGTSLIIRIST